MGRISNDKAKEIMYQFCPENQRLVENLISTLKDSVQQSVWNNNFSIDKTEEETPPSSQIPIAPLDLTTPNILAQSSQSIKRPGIEETESSRPSKKRKLELTQCDQRTVSITPVQDINDPTQLDVHYKEKCLKIFDTWQNEQKADIADLEEVLSGTNKLESVFMLLGLADCNESVLSIACTQLASISSTLSFNSVLNFLTYAILPRLENGECGSRLLLTTLTLLTDVYPQQMMHAVLFPVLSSCQEKEKAEVIVKIITGTSVENINNVLLRLCTKSVPILNEFTLSIYHTLLDFKGQLSSECIHFISQLIALNASTYAKNLKFGKFIMSFLSKYGKQLNLTDIIDVQHAVETHKSFLQKSLKTAITKLKN